MRSSGHRVRSARLVLAPVLLAASFQGCGLFAGPVDEVVFRLDSTHYEAGEQLRYEIANHWADEVFLIKCLDGNGWETQLLRRVRGEWTDLGYPCDGRRTILLTLEPGERVTGTRRAIDGTGVAGLYALALHYRHESEWLIANTKPFQVTE